ncbi:MAG: rhomboid family intramembrane serine protease [Chloroflexi bacterium]|nr:rhomboid family intramembrane serine protease [Chloroflexota bacterium]
MADDLPTPSHADLAAAVASQGPLDRATALGLLDRAAELLAAGEYLPAARAYQRVAGVDDAAITAAAWLGLGEALYRLDHETEAVAAWESVLRLSETPSTYTAWRNVAAARVRAGDLREAVTAYREADKRAPVEDKAEIASRLGWLAKETGDTGAARRYFARSRGDGPAIPLAWLILGATVIVSFFALSTDGTQAALALELDKQALAHGELYRLFSVTLVHANLVHLAVNMYALYLLGPLVEGIWGSATFGLFYLLTAAAASTVSFLASPEPSVGASGAIFGLVGVALAGTRIHNPVLDRRARAIVPQLGTIVVINLVFGFAVGGGIDNAAHLGGLAAGLWLGLFVPPGRVRTLRDFWQSGEGGRSNARTVVIALLGILGLVAAIAAGLAAGGVTIGA